MTATIQNLWPAISTPDVMSPTIILRQQASLLREHTKGLLEAEVTRDDDNRWNRCTFSIVATQLERYRIDICSIVHESNQPYPVTIYSTGFRSEVREAQLQWAIQQVHEPDPYDEDDDPYEIVASTQDEFVQLLALLLGSKRIKIIIDSLLARTNDIRMVVDEKPESQAE